MSVGKEELRDRQEWSNFLHRVAVEILDGKAKVGKWSMERQAMEGGEASPGFVAFFPGPMTINLEINQQ